MKYSEILDKAQSDLFIIAEAGVNHNGDIRTAYKLIDAAFDAGCDAVKFQTWITDKVYSADKSIKPDYQQLTTSSEESEYQTIKNLELSYDQFVDLKEYCDKVGILFFSTPDEEQSADFLKGLDVDIIKTASQDVTNIPFLSYVSKLEIPVIYSTGACNLTELVEGYSAIQNNNNNVIVLHCVSSYPAPDDQLNLSFIPVLKSMFNTVVGFSDHTTGYGSACAAVALGARVFEKHLTLDKSMTGPDHQASLTPNEMKEYCISIRSALHALGDGEKKVMDCETNTREAFRRYIVVLKDMEVGDIITSSDIAYKKVVNGIHPKFSNLVIGSTLLKNVPADTVLSFDILSLS